MNIVGWCARNRWIVYLGSLLLFGAGLAALFELPSNIYPELNFPRAVIVAHHDDLAPEAMLLAVTRPLEEAALGVQGVRRVRSKTIRGGSEISILFQPDTDMRYAYELLQARISAIRNSLPPDTDLTAERITPALFPVLSFILNGNVPDADLRDTALYVLRPLFSRLPGVGQVQVQATDTREVSVVVDPERALAHRLSLVDIADRLRGTNEVVSVGQIPRGYRQYLVLTTGQYSTLDDIRRTVVAVEQGAPLRLSDLADVRDGTEDRRVLITGNGRPAALINITRQIGGNILELVSQARALAQHLGSAIPPTLHLSVVYDLAEFVQEAMTSVRDAILLGAALAVLILFVFLREVRTTLIAASSLPLSVVSTFFFLRLSGGTLNLMSLGGLAIAIGLVIDDAVVVIENIYRHLGLGKPPATAAQEATAELLGPVVGSTATTLAVFLPLGLLHGVVGEFFSALCWTLGVAVLLSLVFSLTTIPLLSLQFLEPGAHRPEAEGLMAPVYRFYERMVRFAIRHRRVVLGLTVGSVLLAALLYTRLETGFLPEMDEGGYVLDYRTPPGTSLDETDRILRRIEQHIAQMPETDTFSRRTGAELGLFATQPNTGDILVKLKPAARRHRTTQEVMDDLRGWIAANVPGIQVEFSQILQDMIGDLEGTPEPIEVKLFGSDQQELERLASGLQARLRQIPGLVDLQGVVRGNPEILFEVDPAAAGRIGLSVDQVAAQVRAGLFGAQAGELRQADRTIGIRVRFPDWFRMNEDHIRQFPILGADRRIVPLSAVARIERQEGESTLSRENARLMVAVTARLENRDLGSAVRDVQRVMQNFPLPVGYTYEIGGQYEGQQSSFRDLLRVLLLALTAVFAILLAQFRRPLPALIILSAAPLSLLGVFALLLLTETPLNVSSFMGIILMIGLVVKNGIILFQYVEHLRATGRRLEDALVAAGRIRVRPILMTTLATLFGLAPLAVGLGAGAELQKPLALAVIGGLSLSTLITLLVMPALYALADRRGNVLPAGESSH
jgi:CzcA family heavy metal efflux pump